MRSSVVHRPLGIALSCLAVCGVAHSQTGLPPEQVRAAGHGAIQLTFDTQAQSGNALLLGCAYLNGVYYVSGRNTAGPNHLVYRFDASGALLGSFAQQETPMTTDWGYRDGATDGAALMFGSENGVWVIDTSGNIVSTITAANGPQSIANPIGGPALAMLGVIRGLAYDPNGNGGNGSFWSGNFGSDLIEFDLNGAVLTQHGNQGQSTYGLALDDVAGTLWVSSIPGGGAIGEIDPATGTPTGAMIPRYSPGSAQGGLSQGPANGSTFVALDQALADRVTVYRNHIAPGVLGKTEERLELSINGGPFSDAQFRTLTSGTVLDFRVSGANFPGQLNTTLFNFENAARTNGVTSFGGMVFPELVALSAASMPAGFVMSTPSVNGSALSATLPAAFLPDGELVRMQGLHLLASGIAVATNQMFLNFAGPTGAQVRIEAIGANSLNSDATNGFFRVTHLGNGAAIDRVELTWVGSSNANQATMEWDTDSENLADRFDGGNSAASGCAGTYRNGSDVLTGLIYIGTAASACDSTALTGWIGSDAGNAANDWRSLEFNFSSGSFSGGKAFEFDADTDGGQGVSGADMAGLVVRVTLAGGAVLVGELVVDAGSAVSRSVVDL